MAKNDIRQKLAEFKINGYVIFEDLLPAEKVDKLQAAFMPLLENVRAMTLGHETPGPQFEPRVVGDRRTGQGRLLNVNRYNVEVPWQPPFSDPEVYENLGPTRVLGPLLGNRRLFDYALFFEHSRIQAASTSHGTVTFPWCPPMLGWKSARTLA